MNDGISPTPNPELQDQGNLAPSGASAQSFQALRAVAQMYVDMIHGVEQRCMAADGPVTKTCDEITDDELRRVYVAALAALEAA